MSLSQTGHQEVSRCSSIDKFNLKGDKRKKKKRSTIEPYSKMKYKSTYPQCNQRSKIDAMPAQHVWRLAMRRLRCQW